MYHNDDYPSSPSSVASSPSSSKLRHSIPHLHTHSSPLSSHSHAHSYGQRASKASDIAHLLDPAYSPSRMGDNQIYVDHAGEAHDPDFRLFAPAHYSPKRGFAAAEPPCDSDDEEVEDEGIALYSFRRRDEEFVYRRSSFDSYRPSSPASSSRTQYNSPTGPRLPTHDSGYGTFSYSAFNADADAGYASDEEPRREKNKLRRRRNSDEVERPVELPREDDDDERRVEWTPTASHALRRQWHAICLRTQVAAFRARKRVTRVVAVKPKASAG